MNIDDYGKAMTKMHNAYGWDYLYRQLAEECAELNKACLKLVRAVNKETPVPEDVAAAEYIEEIADVWLMIAIARTDMSEKEKAMFDQTVKFKYDRMMARMEDRLRFKPLPGMRTHECSCADMAKRMEDDLK